MPIKLIFSNLNVRKMLLVKKLVKLRLKFSFLVQGEVRIKVHVRGRGPVQILKIHLTEENQLTSHHVNQLFNLNQGWGAPKAPPQLEPALMGQRYTPKNKLKKYYYGIFF